MANTNPPAPVDLHVGSRLRLRRRMAGVSQEDLAQALGLSFQQMQKYEKGANRISASKLYAMALYLKTPIDWFFGGLTDKAGDAADDDVGPRPADMQMFLTSREGADLAVAAARLPPDQRRQILTLIRGLAAPKDVAQSP